MDAQVDPLNEGPKQYRHLRGVGSLRVHGRRITLETMRESDQPPTPEEVRQLVEHVMTHMDLKEVVYPLPHPETQARYDALPLTIEVLGETLHRGELMDLGDVEVMYESAEDSVPFHLEVTFSCEDSWQAIVDSFRYGPQEVASGSQEEIESLLVTAMKEQRDILDKYLRHAKEVS